MNVEHHIFLLNRYPVTILAGKLINLAAPIEASTRYLTWGIGFLP
jgi:hypothetical protein